MHFQHAWKRACICTRVQINLGVKWWSASAGPSWKPVSDELIKGALETVLDTNLHPILVMCS